MRRTPNCSAGTRRNTASSSTGQGRRCNEWRSERPCCRHRHRHVGRALPWRWRLTARSSHRVRPSSPLFPMTTAIRSAGGRRCRRRLARCSRRSIGRRIRAISIDGTSGTMLPVSRRRRAACHADDVQRSGCRPRTCWTRIAAHAPKESAAHGATSGLAKLLLFQSVPDVFRVIHQADWLAGHFTGLYDVSDENNALEDRLRSRGAVLAGVDRTRPARASISCRMCCRPVRRSRRSRRPRPKPSA